MKRKFHQEKRTMKKCELCIRVARTHCESDQASLCWTCDFKVHAANFLVARHSRTLLCQICQSPTPWSAAGAKLGPAVSVCGNCIRNCRNGNRGKAGCTDNDFEIESDGSSDEAEVGVTSSEQREIDMEDNRRMPRSPTKPPPPPPASSSTSSNSDIESYSSGSSSSSSYPSHHRRKITHQKANQKRSSCGANADTSSGSVAVAVSPAVACSGGGCKRKFKRRRLVDSSWIGTSPISTYSKGPR